MKNTWELHEEEPEGDYRCGGCRLTVVAPFYLSYEIGTPACSLECAAIIDVNEDEESYNASYSDIPKEYQER